MASDAYPRGVILFDLDGTLVDSFAGIAAAYHETLTALDLGDRPDSDIVQFIGPPIQEVLTREFGLEGDRLQEGIRVFRHSYGTNGLLEFTKYTGVDEVLASLRSDGYGLCVATSKQQTMAVDVIAHAGWTEHFDVVGGALPDGSRHLKRDVIEWTIGEAKADATKAVMVGDRASDIVGAHSLGLHAVGVAWGYGTLVELVDAGATSIAEVPDHLSALVGLSR